MKINNFLVFVIFFVMFSCQNSSVDIKKEEMLAPKRCVISGYVNQNYNTVYLQQLIDDERVTTDSVQINNGTFIFKPINLTPQIINISFDDSKNIAVFVENDSIQIYVLGMEGDSIAVEGTNIHLEWVDFNTLLTPFDIQMDSLIDLFNQAYELKDEVLIEQYIEEYDKVDSLKTELINNYIMEHPKSYLSPYLVIRYLAFTTNIEELEDLKNRLDQSVQNSVYVNLLNHKIDKVKKTAIGQVIPEFELADTVGNMISIRQFKGYYVLIDFWASWSEYCRLENPNIVKAYHQFKKDGFTVVGVSLDEDKEDWLKAIKNDQLTWTQLSDLKGWSNSVVKDFSISSIPASILIDPDQVIIAKNLRGDDLIEELSKYLRK